MIQPGHELATPRISVVVATYNRAETLRQTLHHLQAQSLPADAYEVIVVDDGSSDNTGAVVEAMRERGKLALEYLHHANRGPGYTQNRGIRAARSPVVLLIADDIWLCPNALAAHLAVHERDSAAEVAVLGRVLQSPGLTQTVFLSKWEPFRLGDLPDRERLPYYMFWACNISFNREFMLQRGMFTDAMGRAGPAAHEDVELGYRLHQHGLRIIFCREALGHHHHVETLEGTLRRSYQRGLNWLDFRRRVSQPEIDIMYRTYNLPLLLARRADLAGSRREYLMAADRSLLRMSMRYLLRSVVFNRLTVNVVWLPLFAGAERIRWLGTCMSDKMYRGVVVYYFLKGLRDGGRVADSSEVK